MANANHTIYISDYEALDNVVRYFFSDTKGPLGAVWCGLAEGVAIVHCSMEKNDARCIRAIKRAMLEFLYPMLKSMGYKEVYCDTTHKKQVSLFKVGEPEVVAHTEDGVPIYRMDI